MTYAIGMVVDEGIAFMSDTRTNAGIDNISIHGKMHVWEEADSYCLTLMAAGNLATHQEVRERFSELVATENFSDEHQSMFKVANSLGKIIKLTIKERAEQEDQPGSTFFVSAILGGQVQGGPPRIFLIYPEGNFIEASEHNPYLAIGEHKYGKPIITARYEKSLNEAEAYDLLIKSMELTAANNLAVGAPIDFHFYRRDSFVKGSVSRTDHFDPLNSAIRELSQSAKKQIPNPALDESDGDFYDQLRELKSVTTKLSSHIRSINDPNMATADVRAVRAYIDAFQEFIDLDGSNRPDAIPQSIRDETENSIRRVDWLKVSDSANKWARAILEFLKLF
ncbi:putative proteasome-type protease [Labrenzia sp. MBR-25]